MPCIVQISFPIVLAVILLQACNNSSDKAETKTGFITVADSKLYYETTGKGEAVVLLHGGFLDRRMWEKQVKEFSKNYQVITCDLRGHGSTTDGDSSYFMYEAIRMLLDTLQVKKATIAGLSVGAIIATDFAIEYPQYTYKLVLVTPGLNRQRDTTFSQDSSIDQYSELLKMAVEKDHDTAMAAEYFIRCWFDGPHRNPEETDTTERKKAVAMAVATMKTHKLLHWARYAEPVAEQRLKNISSPALIIIADKDNYRISKNAEALKAAIPNARIMIINNAAHMPNMERPAEFNKLFLAFLKGK